MNERDYSILSQISIITGMIFLLFGGYLFDLFGLLNYINTVLLISVFIFFFTSAVYFNYKKDQFVRDMMDEINRHIGKGDDDFKSP